MARRQFKISPTRVSASSGVLASSEAKAQIAELITELDLMGFDTTTREGILEGLGAGLGYAPEDQQVLVERILEAQGRLEPKQNSTASRPDWDWDDVESATGVNGSKKNYGGAFDIDPTMFFTREDLDELNEAVIDYISGQYPGNYKIEDSYIGGETNQDVHIEVEDENQCVHVATAHIDMRKIRNGHDLADKYAKQLADSILNRIDEYNEVMEDVEDVEGAEELDVTTPEWDELDVYQQTARIKEFIKQYKGTRVFEDFADSIDVPVEDVIDLFCDAESHGFIRIPKRMQKDSDYANDDVYSSTDETDSANVSGLDTLKEKLYNTTVQLMNSMPIGYTLEEARDYVHVDITEEEGSIRVEVRAEVSFATMLEISEELDKIVQEIDEDAYFDLDQPGIMSAYIDADKAVNAATVVGGIYDAMGVYGPNPPEPDDDIIELPDEDDEIYLDLDAVIILDKDGSWDYEDTTYPWARASKTDPDFYSGEYTRLKLSDHISTVESVDSLLESLLPMEAGRYRISGKVTLAYGLTNIAARRGEDEDDAPEIFTGDIEVEFNFANSSISDFQITKLEDTPVESATTIESASWMVDSSQPSSSSNYTNFIVMSKSGNRLCRYRILDNGVDDFEQAADYRFEISKLSPYDDADYVWCRYQSGRLSFIKSGKIISTQYNIPDDENYETFSEWQDDFIARCLDTLDAYNSKISEKIIHN